MLECVQLRECICLLIVWSQSRTREATLLRNLRKISCSFEFTSNFFLAPESQPTNADFEFGARSHVSCCILNYRPKTTEIATFWKEIVCFFFVCVREGTTSSKRMIIRNAAAVGIVVEARSSRIIIVRFHFVQAIICLALSFSL